MLLLSGIQTTGNEDSLMLAFSEGMTLPFLPSDLALEGRLKLLGKLAHRQLRIYQKGKRSPEGDLTLGTRSPSQLLPQQYLNSVELLELKSPPQQKTGIKIQGAYPARQAPTLGTCGISSVGDMDQILSEGRYNVNDTTKEYVADYRELRGSVRPRDGEFLVGIFGSKQHLRIAVSYDENAIDPDKARSWQTVMETILEHQSMETKLAIKETPRL